MVYVHSVNINKNNGTTARVNTCVLREIEDDFHFVINCPAY